MYDPGATLTFARATEHKSRIEALTVPDAHLLRIVCCSLLSVSSKLRREQEHRHGEPAAGEGVAVCACCLVPYVTRCIVGSILRPAREGSDSGVACRRICATKIPQGKSVVRLICARRGE